MSKRNILGDLMEGVAAMKSQREGKLTRRNFKVDAAPLPRVDSKLIRDIRKRSRHPVDCVKEKIVRPQRPCQNNSTEPHLVHKTVG